MTNNFQRIGSKSNAHVGDDFEITAQAFFSMQGIALQRRHKLRLGVASSTKEHTFDLGSSTPKIVVECKSHKWTRPDFVVPAAKLTDWNKAMYLFGLVPSEYRRIFFVLRDPREKHRNNETLAEYYLRTQAHLIPAGVEFWEFDEDAASGRRIA